MPYGMIPNDDRNWIIKRANDSGVSTDKLCLEPEHDDDGDTYGYTYLVSIIVGGALDAEFELGDTLYAVNIADWLAEFLTGYEYTGAEDIGGTNGEDWEVLISDTDGTTVYRVTDESPNYGKDTDVASRHPRGPQLSQWGR